MIKLTPNFTASTAVVLNSDKQAKSHEKTDPGFEKMRKPKKEYNDPLMKWPVRGLAFTNDIGAAVMDIAPKLGTFLWYPAMMYFGADIYDKYRNDKDQYDPNATRGLKQAVFQTLASVVFPIAVVHTGQKIASISARKSKAGLSLQTQEEVNKFMLKFMSERKLKDYAAIGSENVNGYKNELKEALKTNIDESTRKHQNTNFVKKFFNLIFGSKHPEEMGNDRLPTILKMAETKVDLLFDMRKNLLADKKPAKMSDKLFNEFKELKNKYKNSQNPKLSDDPVAHAAKDILKKYESSQIFKVKMWKTVGGFAALALLIKPIDYFVEHVIMHKYVSPGLDSLSRQQINKFKEKNLA